MSAAPHFHPLRVTRLAQETADAVAVTLAVPEPLRAAFAFKPGQFLTVRAQIGGQSHRRSYSICSSRARYARDGQLQIGIKRVAGGVFSNWAAEGLREGDVLEAMPPDGRFTPRAPAAGDTAATATATGTTHRVGFAAGSGITPMLSIVTSTLEDEPDATFTLVYGNQRTASIMFNEALQDLKDRFPARLTLIHLLSRQSQELPLLNGRLDAAKVSELLRTLVPAEGIDEAFICGPEGMIESTSRALRDAGVAPERIHAERFLADGATPPRPQAVASMASPDAAGVPDGAVSASERPVALDVVMDGKTHHLRMGTQERVLDVALDGGLDLPWSCKGGVCCTCRAKVLEGQVRMERNFTLEPWEVDKGFVLTCQSVPLTPRVVVSYDER